MDTGQILNKVLFFILTINNTSRIGPNVGFAAALETKMSIPPKWCSVCEKDSGPNQLDFKLQIKKKWNKYNLIKCANISLWFETSIH